MKLSSPLGLSLLAWVGGGVLGLLLSRKHRVAGAAIGMLAAGAVADKLIENNHPEYTGG